MRMVRLPQVRTLPIRRSYISLICSVRGRIIVGFGLLVLLLAAGAVGSILLTRQHQSQLVEMEEHTITTSLLQDAKLSGSLSLTVLQHYLLTGDETAVPEIRAYLAASVDSLTEALAMEETRGDEEEIAKVNQLTAVAAFLTETSEQVIALRQSGDVQGAISVMGAALPRLEQIGIQIDRVTEFERQEVAALRSRAATAGDFAFWFSVIAGAVGAILGLAASALIARSILKPLRSLESTALAVAGGDLNARAPVRGPRELAHLGASLNQMTDSLLDASRRRELENVLHLQAAALESAANGIAITDRHGRITWVNPAFTGLTGYTPKEAIGNTPRLLKSGKHDQSFYRNLWKTILAGNAWAGEIVNRRKDGSLYTEEQTITPVRDAKGEISHFIAIKQDITDRGRAEEALRASESRFRSALDSMIEGCVIIGLDWRILFANEAFLKRSHWTKDELLGHTMMEVNPGIVDQEVFPYIQRCMGERTPHRMETEFAPTYGIKRWFDISVQPVPEGIFILSLDISERKRAEEALRESEERWRSLVENAPSFITTIDRDGTVLSINRTMTGLTPEQMIGTSIYDYAQPDYREKARECYERVFQTGEAESLETAGIRGDGDPFWYVSHVGPIRHDGQIVALVSITVDATDLKRAEQELGRLNGELQEINASLEERVRERTEELRLANEELRQRNRQLLDARAQAATDSLTGIFNHRTFQERIRNEVSQANSKGTTVSLIMLDIDGFKAVNDCRGHLAGDNILRQLASTIADLVGQEQAYRYGGDEFAVLLPLAGRSDAARIAEQLRRAAESQKDGNAITLSLGVASLPETAGSAEELIYGADAAMYWAKSAGKNRVGDWADLVNRSGDGSGALYIPDRNIKTLDTVGALVAALAAKDQVTAAHVERCSRYALLLAAELGLSEKETATVRTASLLHDVGKIAVPDEVLNKPGPLNEEEWAQMREHPRAALHVLSQITAIAEATPAIVHHHEHFDGSGYPDGLAGEEIPIISRILLVTDAFDAMTTDRPYRKAFSVEVAIDELKANMGTQFDPAIAEAFLRILSRHGAHPLDRAVPTQTSVQAVGPRNQSAC